MLISERVTWLESFNLCPYKYKNIPFDGQNVDTMMAVNTWDIVHLAHQYPEVAAILCDKFFDETIPAITGQRNNLKKEQLHKMIDLACLWIDEFKPFDKYFEVKNSMVIEWVLVTWSYDCLVIEKDWGYRLFDYKTAGNISYYKNWIEKAQVMIYSYFIMKQFKVDRVKVSYQIYVKWKDNAKATVERKTKIFYANKCWNVNQIDYIDNVFEKVERLVRNFRAAKESDMFVPKDINEDWSACSACMYCPLRRSDTAAEIGMEICPLKSQSATLDMDEEIEF